MRRLSLAGLSLALAVTLAAGAAGIALAAALHAPRTDLGAIERITSAIGCTGPENGGTGPVLVTKDGRFHVYVCRSGGATSAFIYDSTRRKKIPMFALPSGEATAVALSERGNQVAIISNVRLTPEPLIGGWGLYRFDRQGQRMKKLLEDDVDGFAGAVADELCPQADIVAFDPPTVVHIDNRGKMIVRLTRHTAQGACVDVYFDLRREF
jgi:hypothetical protein